MTAMMKYTKPAAPRLRREAPAPRKPAPETPARKMQTEVHAYDFRTRNNLKRGA